MAEAAEDTVDCLLCSEELLEPVTLGCEHRFCCRCLREHWAPTDTGDCPTCKRRWSKNWPLFFAMKENYNLSQRQTESSEGQTGQMDKGPDQTPESATEEDVSQEVPEETLCKRLQPNVNKQLCLSEELTSVRAINTPVQDVPQIPERLIYYSSVLGSTGFYFGTHIWLVEVGDHPDWTIGVVKESAERRSRCRASPEDGFWCLQYRHNKYTDVNGETVKLKRRPEIICVVLECDFNGRISFYDFNDKTLTWICTYKEVFTERMFPYFSVGGAGDTDVTKDLKISELHLDHETSFRWSCYRSKEIWKVLCSNFRFYNKWPLAGAGRYLAKPAAYSPFFPLFPQYLWVC